MRRPRRGVHRTVGSAVAGVVSALLLAGCVSIPAQGPVVPGDNVVVGARPRAPELLVHGPVQGSTPMALMGDFLRSVASFDNNHEIAREYVQGDRKHTWRPEDSVVVYPSWGDAQILMTRDGVTVAEPPLVSSPPPPSDRGAPGQVTSGPVSPSQVSPSQVSPSQVSPTQVSPTQVTASPSSATRAQGAKGSAAGKGAAGTPAPSAGRAASGAAASSASRSSSAQLDMSEPPRLGETVTVTVRVPVSARIDNAGRYAIAPAGGFESRRFVLSGTDEGWRISALDDGILLTQSDVLDVLQSAAIYFADPTGRYLVPDLRWFPVTTDSSSTPSQLVSRLLAGPAPWLGPAVTSGAPPGTRLTVNGAKFDSGTATVDLSAPMRSATTWQRQVLKAQLERTLGSANMIRPVASVVVTVDQQAFDWQASPSPGSDAQDGSPDPPEPQLPPIVSGRAVALDAKGGVVELQGQQVVGPVAHLPIAPSPGNSSPAVDLSRNAYAVLTGNRKHLMYAVTTGAVRMLVTGTDLRPPSFDPFGWVWSGEHDANGSLVAAMPGRPVAWVGASWLRGAKLRSVRISREGARAVVVLERPGGGTEALVASVRRDPTGRPIELGPVTTRLLVDAQEVFSASWVDSTTVAVLARRQNVTMPYLAQVGGTVSTTQPVQGGTAVSAADDPAALYVTTATGAVRVRVTGSGWVDVPGVRWASLPG